VAVRYDPANLGEAVLETGAPMLGILAEALVALLLFGVGGVGLYYGLIRQ
jgi:hypothetical protein